MRVTKEKAAENRERILQEAARLFRECGTGGVGVDALTEAAGMTHGSVYSQFGSKDKLLAEALSYGLAANAARSPGVKNATEAVSKYLTAGHRDNPGAGCFMAALGCDMPRQSEEVRHAFTDIVRDRAGRMAGLLPKRKGRKDDALAIVSAMVGAMVLARAVDDPELSGRILAASRARLLEMNL